MSKPVIFHCTPRGTAIHSKTVGMEKVPPTHTLVFERIDDNTLAMGWAVAKGDSYSRKFGRESAIERVTHLITRVTSFPNRAITEVKEISIDVLPKKIVEGDFSFYVNRAVKIFFSNENTLTDINVIFRAYDSAEAGVCKVNVAVVK
jgi:hypothetical protein